MDAGNSKPGQFGGEIQLNCGTAAAMRPIRNINSLCLRHPEPFAPVTLSEAKGLAVAQYRLREGSQIFGKTRFFTDFIRGEILQSFHSFSMTS